VGGNMVQVCGSNNANWFHIATNKASTSGGAGALVCDGGAYVAGNTHLAGALYLAGTNLRRYVATTGIFQNVNTGSFYVAGVGLRCTNMLGQVSLTVTAFNALSTNPITDTIECQTGLAAEFLPASTVGTAIFVYDQGLVYLGEMLFFATGRITLRTCRSGPAPASFVLTAGGGPFGLPQEATITWTN